MKEYPNGGTPADNAAQLYAAALEYADAGWAVFPLGRRAKVPAISKEKGGRGFLDATTDPEQIRAWWDEYPGANIGAAVPGGFVVVDVDPQHDGYATVDRLEAEGCALPGTLTVRTGGGGVHLYYRHPHHRLQGAKLAGGIDVRLPGRHYVVLPPSVHPSGVLYEWAEADEAVALPTWAAEKLRPPVAVPRPVPRYSGRGPRPGDTLNAETEWAELLEPAGWVLVSRNGAVEYWRRPGKSEGVSATTNALGTDRLHVFTTSAPPFEADQSYSKFAAFTLLHHGGDYRAAKVALLEETPAAAFLARAAAPKPSGPRGTALGTPEEVRP